MMTPQEVSEHAFSKASFGGYNMAMVDEFLDLLTEDYTTLYKENATLKAKMKVLVEKVEEYRATEDAMRKALLTAQKMADEMIAEAEAKKADILTQAENDARARSAELQKGINEEQARLSSIRAATSNYVGKLKELYQHEMDYLNGLSFLSTVEVVPPAPAHDPVSQAADDISASVERLVAQAQADVQAQLHPEAGVESAPPPMETSQITVDVDVQEKDGGLYAELMELNLKHPDGERRKRPIREPDLEPAEAGAGAEDVDDCPTRRLDFNNLQFGKDYEIK